VRDYSSEFFRTREFPQFYQHLAAAGGITASATGKPVRAASLAKAPFFRSNPHAIGFWPFRRLRVIDAKVSDPHQKPACGAECSEHFCVDLHCHLLRRPTMQKGTVKWFNPTKGYGFIKPATGDKDVFVHISAVERAGLSTLNEGQVVEYELVTNRGKTSAENLKV
jgi:cold shock protein